MSFKTVLQCINHNIKQYFKNLQEEKTESVDLNKLKAIQFYDISKYFPKEHFVLDKEPVYGFYRLIGGKRIVLLNDNQEKKEVFVKLLSSLFIEKEIGKQKLFFSDFSEVTNSKEDGNYSFSEFKSEQFARNEKQTDFPYIDYDSVRNDVFNTDKACNSNSIKDAIVLKWSNSIFANNRDRSHRFALLCKWNELDNRNDSEFFNVREISINRENVINLLNDYYGFIISSKTASEIIQVYKNNTLYNWQNYCPFWGPSNGEVVGFFIEKKDLPNEVFELFFNSSNCIFINDLLWKFVSVDR